MCQNIFSSDIESTSVIFVASEIQVLLEKEILRYIMAECMDKQHSHNYVSMTLPQHFLNLPNF